MSSVGLHSALSISLEALCKLSCHGEHANCTCLSLNHIDFLEKSYSFLHGPLDGV